MFRTLREAALLSLVTLVISCERAIEFEPVNPEPKLVVDATIETGGHPIVYLTRSLEFFTSLSVEKLAGSFVHGATITVSNGASTYQLKEYEIPAGNGFSLYYYSVDSASMDTLFRGQTGKSYLLAIEVGGETYTATTTIPENAKTLDTIYYEQNVDDEDSTKVVVYGTFTDPGGFGNYSRYFTSVNGGPYLPGMNSVEDDQVIDGKTYNLQIEQGVDRNTEIDFEEYAFFRKGDNISVKFCNIDKAVFDFWRTMEFSYASIGNPFSSPSKVLGNISNGALGYFGGYAVQYSGFTIPE